jgi:hypothetical protein
MFDSYLCRCGYKVTKKRFELDGHLPEHRWVCDNPQTPHTWGLPSREGDFEYNSLRSGSPGLPPWHEPLATTVAAQLPRTTWAAMKSSLMTAMLALAISGSLFFALLPQLSRTTTNALATSRILV